MRRKYRNSVYKNTTNRHLYDIWSGIKKRCFNEKCERYSDYGGRGITMCDEWANDFDTFADWGKENGYELGLSIDRIDNDGNYEPSNCKWSTCLEQGRNKRDNKYVEYKGELKALSEWCDILNLKYDTIHARIEKGWDIETAFTKPIATEKESFSSICRKHNIKPSTARDRIVKLGWSFEKAINTPCLGIGANASTYS